MLVQKIKQHPFITVGIVVVILLIVAFTLAVLKFGWDWTGFKGGESKTTTTTTSKGVTTAIEMQPGKALWDWLNLFGVLAIPAVVGLGATWYTAQQGKVSERENTDNQRHAVLQAYIDKMSELLLNGQLAERTADGQLNPKYKQVCDVSRVRTITVLVQLDARRVGYVFAFLREAGLISATKDDDAISLKNADLHAVNWSQTDLRGADLRGADLREANLSGANLSGANLSGANLSGANLSGVNLSGNYVPRAFGGTIVVSKPADLRGADLSQANLSGAKFTDEQLKQAKSLEGATIPNGRKRP